LGTTRNLDLDEAATIDQATSNFEARVDTRSGEPKRVALFFGDFRPPADAARFRKKSWLGLVTVLAMVVC
jgi:hypothetical protein